jgi:MFS family permease
MLWVGARYRRSAQPFQGPLVSCCLLLAGDDHTLAPRSCLIPGSHVYQIENSRQVLGSGRRFGRSGWRKPSRNVVLLGLTSMFTDISAEMVNTILPLYLVFTLGLAPFQFGLIDGIYQGGSALVRIASGFIADRIRTPKAVAVAGYALSAVTKLGFLAAQGAAALTVLIIVDRIGKGIRTTPRDALISLSSKPADLGLAFGVHRALDTVGAMIGPLLGFVLLFALPNAFDAVFVVSFCFAIVGLGILGLFVRDVRAVRESDGAALPAPSVRDAAAVLAAPRFRLLVLVGSGLGLLTVSDAFIYLVLQRRLDFNIGFFPLLYVATAIVYMILATPVGQLADRIGRGRVFVAGYVVLAVVYASLLLPGIGPFQVVVTLGLLGAYYAMTDGVLAALASGVLPPEVRGSGLGILGTATSLARLVASVLFGLFWTLWDVTGAVGVFLVCLVVCTVIAAVLLGKEHMVSHE